ncbi:OPT family oligopeptide transporter [Tepidibacter thalassicus]|uniref:Putative oligopeptide transporter, OPT family n=1 Tax=Tepidibacter thalassicus DSM 15285 TaxID=1123350 RepID=A0A1M5SI13_9FIRM|nr:oligopeptide transporter, OPT family [Tepidibacter thalassicus]SHH38095.1 putative oligopeptide transporter, OPT family [Tepidibacter thalassicus DSM 15285]
MAQSATNLAESKKRKGLDPGAYQKIPGTEYKPYISASTVLPELTLTSIIIGIVLSIVFGAANAYLGLRLGQTVGASVPAAVASMAILRGVLQRGNVLENNMCQTIGSAGESLAAGVIFTIPALIVWGMEVSLIEVSAMALCGGLLGICFLLPLRRYLTVEEHGNLPFPDGTACAEVIVAGESGGENAKLLFVGGGISAVYAFLMKGLQLWHEEPEWTIPGFDGAVVGIDAYPSLLGLGFIMGPKISAIMLAGAVLGWIGLIPLIKLIGANASAPLYPGTVLISQMDHWDIWSSYIRYIGAGAVVFGGIWGFIKILPVMIKSFSLGFANLTKTSKNNSSLRTDTDMNMGIVFIMIAIIFVFIAFVPPLKFGILRATLAIVFSFFFVPVAARMTGMTSNNPVSGMTIATLLATCLILKSVGYAGEAGMVAALSVGVIVCIAAAVTGDMAQDLKTGHLLGATPKKQQIGEIIGTVAAAIAIGFVIKLLTSAYQIGSQDLPAPQANLMSMVVKGVMTGSLPWNLIFIGMGIGAMAEMIGLPVLPFAVGLYLPIHLSTPAIIGGFIRGIVDKKFSGHEGDIRRESGVLLSSGMVAGDALMGVLLAIFAVIKVGEKKLSEIIAIGGNIAQIGGSTLSLVMFMLMAVLLYYTAVIRKVKIDE